MDENVQEIVEVLENEIDNVEENIGEIEEIEEKEIIEEDELDLFESERYNIGGYDFTAFKDDFNLDEDANVESLSKYVAKYKDLGLTQQQVEGLIRTELEDETEEEEKPKVDYKEKLKTELDTEEKRNYKNISSFTSNLLKGTKLEGKEKSIMKNPQLVSFLNIIYKSKINAGAQPISGGTRRTTERKMQGSTISIDDAVSQVQTALKNKADLKPLVAQLEKNVDDKEGLKAFLSAIM